MLTRFSLPLFVKTCVRTTVFRPIKGAQTNIDVKNKTMQLRTVLLLSILCILPCCGFPCEYCNFYTTITCYFTFYTQFTLHYIWLWRLLPWKKKLFTAEMRPAQAPGGKKCSSVYKIYHIDYLTSLTFLTSCQSSPYAYLYQNSKIEKNCVWNSTHELHELYPLAPIITIMLL